MFDHWLWKAWLKVYFNPLQFGKIQVEVGSISKIAKACGLSISSGLLWLSSDTTDDKGLKRKCVFLKVHA